MAAKPDLMSLAHIDFRRLDDAALVQAGVMLCEMAREVGAEVARRRAERDTPKH